MYNHKLITYVDDGLLGNEGEDVCAGDNADAGAGDAAGCLDLILDPVDHVEAA